MIIQASMLKQPSKFKICPLAPPTEEGRKDNSLLFNKSDNGR